MVSEAVIFIALDFGRSSCASGAVHVLTANSLWEIPSEILAGGSAETMSANIMRLWS